MSKAFQFIRGMPDALPEWMQRYQLVERQLAEVLGTHGFQPIGLPVVELRELFVRSVGGTTDVVQKEMYALQDRDGTDLVLRPEGTAGCTRAVIQHRLAEAGACRLWYNGTMFRYERPQKGRQRQFIQLGAEIYAAGGRLMDMEILLLTVALWHALGMENSLHLQLNHLGSEASRARYRKRLSQWLHEHSDKLDETSLARIDDNPLRVLDSKHPDTIALLETAPLLWDDLDPQEQADYRYLQETLTASGVNAVHNPRLVRGLDYYTGMVFEWVSDDLGAQATVCAGGRYDDLVQTLGGKAMPAVGFALGWERLLLHMQARDLPAQATREMVYLLAMDEAGEREMPVLAHALRTDARLAQVSLVVDHASGNTSKRLGRADRSGAVLALLVGERELEQNQVVIKQLRGAGEQQSVNRADLASALQNLLKQEG